MKVGISISNFSWPIPLTDFGSTVARIARTADEAGVDSLWVMDHFFQIRVTGEPPEAPITEAYATRAWDEYVKDEIFPRDGDASDAAVQALIDVSALIRAVRNRVKSSAADYINRSWLHAAQRELAAEKA